MYKRQLVLRVSGDDIVRGSLSAVADGGDDMEKAVADGICDDRLRLVGDSGKQQRHCNLRSGHVRIIRDVREDVYKRQAQSQRLRESQIPMSGKFFLLPA